LLAATAPRLRGWEYRHLASRLDRSLPSPFPADWRIARLNNSTASGAVAILRTDERGSTDWVVIDSDLRTQRLEIPGTFDDGLALSPDGKRAVWITYKVGDSRPVELWSVDTNKLLAAIPTQPMKSGEYAPAVTWSPAGDRFAVSHETWSKVYDGHTGALVDRGDIEGFAVFTGDSRWMLMRDSRSLRLLDARTLEPQAEVLQLESRVWHAIGSFLTSRVICIVEDGTLRLLDIVDGALHERSRIPAGIGVLTAAAWSPDGRLVAGASRHGRVRVWEADTGILRGDFAGPQAATSALWFLPDSGNLWVCDIDGHHRVWPISDRFSTVLAAHRSFVYPTVVSKDGGLLLTGGWDGAVGLGGGLKLWDPRSGTLVAEYGRPGEIFDSADLTPDGWWAVAGIRTENEINSRTEVVDLATGAVLKTFRPPAATVQAMCTIVHPDGRRAVSTYIQGEAYVWDIVTGRVLWGNEQSIQADPQEEKVSFAAAVSRDGRLIALADQVLGIRLMNADTYTDIRRWNAHQESFWSLSFSADGKCLLSASDDDTIGVWDVGTGQLIARLVGHNADVLCAAMSPDGTRIASGGRDGYVRLWDTAHFDNVAQLGGHKDYIFSLTWSPDGAQLISSSGDSTVRIWDTRTLAEQVGAARARTEALPRIEALVAKAQVDAQDSDAVVSALAASPQFDERQSEVVRQVAMRFAFNGQPAYYRAPHAGAPIVIDGRIDEPDWNAAPWSEPFIDIEGHSKLEPRFQTRVRMLWDEKYLYVAARLEEPHVWATLANRDDIVLNDNDFEVFVDPEGDARFYGEVEVNALGTIFDLRLNRPYMEGGPADHGWSPEGMQAAAAVAGTLNDPTDVDREWTVEIAIPHAAFADHCATSLPPRPGDVWRINFSRVEWQHDVVDGRYVKRPGTKEDNWVWTPQFVVDMHRPRQWGFVEFLACKP
jgi:WD40 repeat protein